eukprot:7906187-Karenia_brevis.AAC.1
MGESLCSQTGRAGGIKILDCAGLGLAGSGEGTTHTISPSRSRWASRQISAQNSLQWSLWLLAKAGD